MKRLITLGWSFFWISSLTLGGGMAMLPLMDREFVEKRGWLTSDEMLDIVAVMQSLPGLIVVNMAVLIGYRVRGVLGALVATFAAILTPYAVIALLAHCMAALSGNPVVDHVFLGIRAGTAALILMSLLKLARQVFTTPFAWTLGLIGFLAAVILKVDITLIILLGFTVGICLVVHNSLKEAKACP